MRVLCKAMEISQASLWIGRKLNSWTQTNNWLFIIRDDHETGSPSYKDFLQETWFLGIFVPFDDFERIFEIWVPLTSKHQFNTKGPFLFSPQNPQNHAVQRPLSSTHLSVQNNAQYNTPSSSTRPSVHHTPQFNTSLSSTHLSVQNNPNYKTSLSSTRPSVEHSLSSTRPSVHHTLSSTHPTVQHTSQFKTTFSTTYLSVQHTPSSTRPLVQHTPQLNITPHFYILSFQHTPKLNTKITVSMWKWRIFGV